MALRKIIFDNATVGARDLGERLEHRKKWRQRWDRLTGKARRAKEDPQLEKSVA